MPNIPTPDPLPEIETDSVADPPPCPASAFRKARSGLLLHRRQHRPCPASPPNSEIPGSLSPQSRPDAGSLRAACCVRDSRASSMSARRWSFQRQLPACWVQMQAFRPAPDISPLQSPGANRCHQGRWMVTLFSPVEELVAVTVAPGMAALPDFTTPEIEKLCVAGASCASERRQAASRKATLCQADVRHPP